MAKKNKMRQITGDLEDEFADIFMDNRADEVPISPVKKSKSQHSIPEPVQQSTKIDEKDLDEWLVQDAEVSQLKTQIQEMTEQFAQERKVWQTEQERLHSQMEEFKRQTEVLKDQTKVLQIEHDATHQALENKTQELRAKIELSRQSSDATLSELFQQRGLRTHTDFGNFFRLISETSHCWTLFKDGIVDPDLMTDFLNTEVHMIDQSLTDVSAISGISIPVTNDRCELSGGVNFLEEIRELVTELLLQGWSRILFLGVPRDYGTFVRNQMGTGTLEVKVDTRESQWVYTDDMKSFSAIFLLGDGRERIPKDCPAQIFVSSEPIVGKALQNFRQILQGS